MTAGYTGKILRINLTTGKTSIIDTANYEEFCGGNGMSAAIFWDLCPDKTISGFDPRNVVTIMPGPLAGTPVPGGSRMEICGNNVFSYPIEWFNRSNIGGFFSVMLKYAGWDGIVIEGKASKPVWLNIINDKVTIEDAGSLWGQLVDTAQDEIWRRVTGKNSFGEWLPIGDNGTTQGPAILCIGPGGESLSRMGTIQSGIGVSASQGGFGGVWGGKNLKAVSVLGTGSVKVADINALLATRQWASGLIGKITSHQAQRRDDGRQVSCAGCFWKCKSRRKSGRLQDAMCLRDMYRTAPNTNGLTGSDIISLYGLNMNDLSGVPITDGPYIDRLYKMGVLGPGKEIDSYPLPMEKFADAEFAEALCKAIVNREGIGADLAEGLMRAAKKWGRLEQDQASGLLHKSAWGYGWHWHLPYVEQGYGSLVGERDTDEHGFSSNRLWSDYTNVGTDKLPPEKFVKAITAKMIPYDDDPLMWDFSWQKPDGSNMKQALATGIYSEHKAKYIAWHRHYTRLWMESVGYCDHLYPVYFDPGTTDFLSVSHDAEQRFYAAVTGKNPSFAETVETGRKIWNINRAIWTLQGRHRNIENFAPFMYTPAGDLNYIMKSFASMGPPGGGPPDGGPPGGGPPGGGPPGVRAGGPPTGGHAMGSQMTVYKNGQWAMEEMGDMYLDKAGWEHWKTEYYKVEGWDVNTGWPTRKTLEELGLKNVADALKKAGKLGSPG